MGSSRAGAQGERGGLVHIRPDLGRRLKAVSALLGTRIEDVLSPMVERPLERLERQARARYESAETRTHGREID